MRGSFVGKEPRLSGDTAVMLSSAQERVLRQVSRGPVDLTVFHRQTVDAVVVRGFVRPGSPPVLTPEGVQALRTGVSRRTVRVGGLAWCEIASLDTWVVGDAARSAPAGWEGVWSLRRLPVWGVYGPGGAHLLYRGQGCWWLRCAGMRDPRAHRVPARGARAAMAQAAGLLHEWDAPVFVHARKGTTPT